MSGTRTPVTLADIARDIGMSKATVSLALRGCPRISRDTRLKVENAAARLGYSPHPLIRAQMSYMRTKLRRNQSDTLAFVTRFPCEKRGVNEADQLYLKGARARATELGFNFSVFSTADMEIDDHRLDQILRHRGIQGVLISALPTPTGVVTLHWDSYSCATIGFTLRNPPLHRACPDSFSNLLELLSELRRRGYRRIGVISNRNADERGYYQAHAAFLIDQHLEGATGDLFLIVDNFAREPILRWFARERPDAIVCFRGPELHAMLVAEGVSVPHEVGIANPFSMPSSARISGISQNLPLLASSAVDLIVGQLHGNERGIPANPKRIFTSGYWVEGETVRPATAATTALR